MKDIVIKGASVRRELFILLGCFVAAVGLNIFAIIKYSRPATELVSMIGYVIFAAVCIYLVLWILRLLVLLLACLVRLFRR